jgi:hypothetical protein
MRPSYIAVFTLDATFLPQPASRLPTKPVKLLAANGVTRLGSPAFHLRMNASESRFRRAGLKRAANLYIVISITGIGDRVCRSRPRAIFFSQTSNVQHKNQ